MDFGFPPYLNLLERSYNAGIIDPEPKPTVASFLATVTASMRRAMTHKYYE